MLVPCVCFVCKRGSQSTVQVIPADQLKSHSTRGKAANADTLIVQEAASVAQSMATTVAATVRTTRSSQSTTEVILATTSPGTTRPQYQPPTPRYQPPILPYQPPTLPYQPSTLPYQPPTLPYQPPALQYQPSTIRYQPQKQPTLEEYIEALPAIRLPINYTVITTVSTEQIDRELFEMTSQESVFGLDMEWKPSFRKNVPASPTGLIQICGASKILLIQVSQMKGLSDGLIRFLTDHTIYKTGVNIRGDGVKLYKDFKVLTDGLLDLRPIATDALDKLPAECQHNGSKSLRSLTGIFLGMNMPKGSIRKSNWNTANLSPKQVEYAANDAFASYALYHTLMDVTKWTKSVLRPHHLSREAI
ncbi:ribonuclease H-like domain-containing protein [Absidia repens]|uniref:3'-5' exonuclease n=1 Tax=Absidia repens TaxID=90262 RepID=A0A1X2IDJ6_9FUNG|nr:ribonuclease H-like domain-containing protein [Absidia repens]